MNQSDLEWAKDRVRVAQSRRERASVCKSKQDEPDEQQGARESSQLIMRDIEKERKITSKACHPNKSVFLFKGNF